MLIIKGKDEIECNLMQIDEQMNLFKRFTGFQVAQNSCFTPRIVPSVKESLIRKKNGKECFKKIQEINTKKRSEIPKKSSCIYYLYIYSII